MKHHEGFKKIAAMICAALVLPYAAIPVGSAENLIMGDVNEDAIVDVFDLALLKRGVGAGTELPLTADVNGDGVKDSADIRLLQDFILGKNVAFVQPAVKEFQSRY